MKEPMRLPKSLLWVLLTLLGVPVLAFVAFLTVHEYELSVYLRIAEDVSEQLGFETGSPYEEGTEVLIIAALEQGKPMASAGFRVGDHLECDSPYLYKTIIFGQGQTAVIPVRRGEKKMGIQLQVPRLSLRDDPSKLYWTFRFSRTYEWIPTSPGKGRYQ